MTKESALQLVQNECDRLCAKYNLKAYVRLPSDKNHGNTWGAWAFCQIIIEDKAWLDVSHEWMQFTNQNHLKQMAEDAFHKVAQSRAKKQMTELALASQR